MTAVPPQRDEQTDEADDQSSDSIKDVMVGGKHHGDTHRQGDHKSEQRTKQVAPDQKDREPDQERPAKVQARHRRKRVDEWAEGLRLIRRLAVKLHRIDEAVTLHQTRRRDGEEIVAEQTDHGGDEKGVADQLIRAPMPPDQPEADDHDRRSVRPKVDPVPELDLEVTVQDEGLKSRLPEDAKRLLRVDHGGGVLGGDGGTLGDVAAGEKV